MGDAAGQVADGIEFLRLPQRFLHREPLVLFGIKPPRPPQHRKQCQEQKQRRRNAEYQVHGHAAHPLVADLDGADADDHVYGEAGQSPRADAALYIVVLANRCIKTARRIGRNAAMKAAVLAEPHIPRDRRIARQHDAVIAHKRELQALAAQQVGIKSTEVARQQRHLDDADEFAAGVLARPAEGEIRLPAGDRLVDAADIDAPTVAGPDEIVERAEILGIRAPDSRG